MCFGIIPRSKDFFEDGCCENTFQKHEFVVERTSIGIYKVSRRKIWLPHPSTLHIAVLQALEEVLGRRNISAEHWVHPGPSQSQ